MSRCDDTSSFSLISSAADIETIFSDSGQETDVRSDSSCAESTSISPSVYRDDFAHGRRYHGYCKGRYPLPNDNREQRREELNHSLMLEITDGQLFHVDIGRRPQKIIDIGTGTGLISGDGVKKGTWAIDVADLYPSASVIGTDLSAIQPRWVPVNVRMFVDDCEGTQWLHGSGYDLVFFRGMAAVLRDVRGLLERVYPRIKKGGWVEFHDIIPQIFCDDDTMGDDDALRLFHEAAVQGLRCFGYKPLQALNLKEMVREAGFSDVRCITKKIPISSWPRDGKLKTLGLLTEMVMLESLDGLAAKPLAELGLSPHQRRTLLEQAEKSLEDVTAHRYVKCCFCYGRKGTAAILEHKALQPYHFRFTPFVRKTYQVGLPADRPICKGFQTGSCPNGTRCSERHVISVGGGGIGGDLRSTTSMMQSGGLNSLVCKHWLRGLCKKGEHCEFLHEYNLRKMPECNFFMRNGYCSNGEECLYLHVDPLTRLPPCPHYDMGFCPLGPLCSKKHVRRKLCPFYLAGFCPDGPECKQGAHAKWSKNLEKPVVKTDDRTRDDHQLHRRHHGSGLLPLPSSSSSLPNMSSRGDDGADDRSGRDGPRDREDGGDIESWLHCN
ncbi:hypothetical protein L249_1342 [Ophiocordyceps polyrhachis-furcata BCC 54312]|uniref:mRNA 3'-end-processing protein n=1 Tax=Ophiocordyceps polyrhachis-furcata BCC 54312 TaxID=1330021 RepID=A0A367LEP9_9HYPO|nr:hypothetical protein L249_1342 [Ophiocordyceps polyrhachis-furcata BCC 54312]